MHVNPPFSCTAFKAPGTAPVVWQLIFAQARLSHTLNEGEHRS